MLTFFIIRNSPFTFYQHSLILLGKVDLLLNPAANSNSEKVLAVFYSRISRELSDASLDTEVQCMVGAGGYFLTASYC